MLEDPQKRELLNQIEEDGQSLRVHRDTASFVTQDTDQLSLLSHEFTFDEILLSTKLYSDKSRLLFQLLRKRVQQAKALLSEDELRARAEQTTSQEIDRQIKREDEFRKNHIFLTFTYPDTHDDLMHQLRNSGVVYRSHRPNQNRKRIEQRYGGVKRFGWLYPIIRMMIWEPGNCLPGVEDVTIHTAGGLSGGEEWLTPAADCSMIILVTDMTNSLGTSKSPYQLLSDAKRFFDSMNARFGCWSIRSWVVLTNGEDEEREHQLRQLTSDLWSSEDLYSAIESYWYTKTEFYNSPVKALVYIILDSFRLASLGKIETISASGSKINAIRRSV
ncbi:hypothetical protein VHEMI01236 [[Torrubiella] hemipterigena]|uniref:Uncharacterized protein n=1 Tax=[Torrubiella] hemipterigena TaxID=1531966 RepID=A0A0A1T486_9HYPO|nr:hypothetical protein VHEMI01236 [[Torrubiella] hemipterigena]